MRLAVVSDIHSNLHALKAVRESIEREGADMVVCAGDIVGYGAFPNECCGIVRDLARFAVLGNHEIAAITRVTDLMNPFAAQATDWTSERLTRESREYIQSLPEGAKFAAGPVTTAAFHGSPESVDEYIYEDDVGEHLFDRLEESVLILGHTHVPFARRVLEKMVVNPGAVGQPRDGDPRASYAVLDTPRMSFRVRRVEYDIEGAAEAILSAGLPPILAHRLFEGR
jgi:putative phosphoesterase